MKERLKTGMNIGIEDDMDLPIGRTPTRRRANQLNY